MMHARYVPVVPALPESQNMLSNVKERPGFCEEATLSFWFAGTKTSDVY
jgi:hypothetical protein